MTAGTLALLTALGIGLVCWGVLIAKLGRWPWRSREPDEHENDATALVPADELERARARIMELERKMPPPDILAMAAAIGGDMSVKQIAYKQLLTKRNNVTVKLAAAHLVRLLRERGEQDSEIYAACQDLVELGCVAPDDHEGLSRAGDRFALDAQFDISQSEVNT